MKNAIILISNTYKISTVLFDEIVGRLETDLESVRFLLERLLDALERQCALLYARLESSKVKPFVPRALGVTEKH